MRWYRWVVFLAVAAAFFMLALSGDVYTITSPPEFGFHVLLRKAYSVVAFAIVGWTFAWALQPPRRRVVAIATLAVALFSTAIEIGQYVTDGNEPFWSNVVDVAAGGAGGAIGGALALVTSWVRAR